MKIIGIGEGDLNTIDNWVEEESFGQKFGATMAARWLPPTVPSAHYLKAPTRV